MKLIAKLIECIRSRYNKRGMYVIADGRDNSVTLSKRLFEVMKKDELSRADGDPEAEPTDGVKIYVFYIPADDCYGFTVNPVMSQETQLCTLQYNEKYKCVGFESLVPTVNRILYDYGLLAFSSFKLSVERCINGMGDITFVYYKLLRSNCKLLRPDEKHTGKHEAS